MQRNILKIALTCSMTLFLTAIPITGVNAAEGTPEVNIELAAQEQDNTRISEMNEVYYVNTENGLKMRSGPSKDSDVVTLLPYKTEVTVTGATDNGWYAIECSGQSGYVYSSYVTKSSNDNTDTDTDSIEDTSATEASSETSSNTFGAVPILTALIAAIVIMSILAIFTAYSFLKKGSDNEETYDEYDEYAADDDYATNDYDNEEINSSEDEEYDEEDE